MSRPIVIRKGIQPSETGIISLVLQMRKQRLSEAFQIHTTSSKSGLWAREQPGARGARALRQMRATASVLKLRTMIVGLFQSVGLGRYGKLKMATKRGDLCPPPLNMSERA